MNLLNFEISNSQGPQWMKKQCTVILVVFVSKIPIMVFSHQRNQEISGVKLSFKYFDFLSMSTCLNVNALKITLNTLCLTATSQVFIKIFLPIFYVLAGLGYCQRCQKMQNDQRLGHFLIHYDKKSSQIWKTSSGQK